MKLISYNVNGIRAAMGKDFLTWLKDANPDVLCIQESKAQPEQIDEQGFKDLGYKCFWYSAEKKGYSGVGILSKQQPKHVEYGIGIDQSIKKRNSKSCNLWRFQYLSSSH